MKRPGRATSARSDSYSAFQQHAPKTDELAALGSKRQGMIIFKTLSYHQNEQWSLSPKRTVTLNNIAL